MTEAGQRQVPVEELLGQEPRRQKPWRAKLGKLAEWRDWKLPMKLAAVTLVPIALAVLLGISVVSGKAERMERYEHVDQLMVADRDVADLLDAIQGERTETAVRLSKGGKTTSALTKARARVDGLRGSVAEAAGHAVEMEPSVASSVEKAEGMLSRLAALRKDVDGGKLDATEAITEYTAITGSLLLMQESFVAAVGADTLGELPQSLRDLAAAKESVSIAQAIVGTAAERGAMVPSERSRVRTAEVRVEDRRTNFIAIVPDSERALYDTTISQNAWDARSRDVRAVLGELGVSSQVAIEKLAPAEWANTSGRVFDQLGQLTGKLSDRAVARSGDLLSESRTGLMVLAVVLGLALVLAVAVVFVITRHLLSSLRILRNSAMSVAEQRLPDAVRSIQEGNETDTSVEPVPVLTRDEVGEVARAFDAVHSQALRLAAEQAGMRAAYSSVFVNLSRRSQSLVQRQLQLIERLERDEEDADQLAVLFQLDHLATRMRRNNENLMMLSGSESGRRSGRPVSTADVLRAAVSEIEQYQRVVVQSPPTTKVVGHAASDLMRLLAELLENSTAFSPPETQVTVATNVGTDGSMTIDVLDKGIGMDESEVDGANARMREASSLAMVTSRRMGLFVVGRLAAKHRIDVRLHGGNGLEGVRASVVVPAELVVGAGGGPMTSEMPVVTDGRDLPRRHPGATAFAPANHTDVPKPRPADGAAAKDGSGHPESEAEISGTALFSPVAGDKGTGKPATNGTKLPKRSPKKNGVKPASGADKDAEAGLPAGKALFKPGTSPLSDWWNAAAEPKPREEKENKPAKPETTPIFDEMLSVWFRTSDAAEDAKGSDKQKAGEEAEAGKTAGSWEFAADENIRAVAEHAKKAEPENLTEAGLPRRKRGEQLLPGSATPEPVEAKPSRSSLGRVDRAPRDPQDVRSRLSGFQRGVQRGKYQAKHRAQEAPAEQSADPKRRTRPAPDRTSDTWEFSADAAWEEAKAIASAQPVSFTETGLPRRRRGEQLLPGSTAAVAKAPAARAPQPDRDPDAVRSRLSGFQQGVRRARQPDQSDTGSTPKVPATSESTDSKSQNNGG